jgi:hypothetical protein
MAIPAPRRPADFPAGALPELARALRGEAGARISDQALQKAGYAVGGAIHRALMQELGGEDLPSLDRDRFWAELARHFHLRGWGRLKEARVHPGMGLITTYDWVEALPSSDQLPQGRDDLTEGDGFADGGAGFEDAAPGCPFSTGIFARILGEVAGGPVAVLEVTCRRRGDESCQFLYGHPDAVYQSYGLLGGGDSLDRALEQV